MRKLRMPSLEVPSDEDATIKVLTSSMGGSVRSVLRKQARRNIPKLIERKVRDKPQIAWTPQLVVKQVRRDTSAKTLHIFQLLGIDDEEFMNLAKLGLRKAGITFEDVAVLDTPKEELTIKNRVKAFMKSAWRFLKGIVYTENSEPD